MQPVHTDPRRNCAQIELNPEADENQVKALLLQAIDSYFSPSIRPKTLKQLVEMGYESQEIFNGPLLENGFLADEEVQNAQLRTEVRQSDLIAIINTINY